MTGGEFIKQIESYRKDGSIPEELTGDDIARALTSAVYGNAVIRCTKGIQEGCLREMADSLKKLHPGKEEQEIVGYIFFWLGLWDKSRRKPLCTVPALFTIKKKMIIREFAFCGLDDFENMRAAAEKLVIWENRKSIPFEMREDDVMFGMTEYCSDLRFADGTKARITVTYQDLTGTVVEEMNDLRDGKVPISWRAIRKKSIPLSRMDKVDIFIKGGSSDPEPEKAPRRGAGKRPSSGKRTKGGCSCLGLLVFFLLFGIAMWGSSRNTEKTAGPEPAAAPVAEQAPVKKKKKKKAKKPVADQSEAEPAAPEPPQESVVSGWTRVKSERAVLYTCRADALSGQNGVDSVSQGERIFVLSSSDGVSTVKKEAAGSPIRWIPSSDLVENR